MIVGFGTSNTSGDTLCPKQFAIRRLLALLEIACESGDAYLSLGVSLEIISDEYWNWTFCVLSWILLIMVDCYSLLFPAMGHGGY